MAFNKVTLAVVVDNFSTQDLVSLVEQTQMAVMMRQHRWFLVVCLVKVIMVVHKQVSEVLVGLVMNNVAGGVHAARVVQAGGLANYNMRELLGDVGVDTNLVVVEDKVKAKKERLNRLQHVLLIS